MSGADTHQATCQCGQLRVNTVGDPDIVMACSCLACQRRTGSPFGMGAYFRKEAASTEGEARVHSRVADSGAGRLHPLLPRVRDERLLDRGASPEHLGVAVGCFAEPGFVEPARVVWSESKHPWIKFPEGVQEFPQGTPRPATPPKGE